MNTPWLSVGILGLSFGLTTPVQANATLFSLSTVGDSLTSFDDFRFGNPAMSSVSHLFTFVPAQGGGASYSGEAAGSALAGRFSLFAHGSGNTFGVNGGELGQFGAGGRTIVDFHDELMVPGTGSGTIVVPWHVDGLVDISATGRTRLDFPTVRFSVFFCQSIATGSSTGGSGCTGGGVEDFFASTDFDKTYNLTYKIQRGVLTSLNTTFELRASSGAGLAAAALADFTHTGLQQPASVFDSNGNLLDVEITAASGLDYRNPQAAVIPLPASLPLFLATLSIIGFKLRRPGASAVDGVNQDGRRTRLLSRPTAETAQR